MSNYLAVMAERVLVPKNDLEASDLELAGWKVKPKTSFFVGSIETFNLKELEKSSKIASKRATLLYRNEQYAIAFNLDDWKR